MKKFVISIPYIYSICPLNIDHARLFVIADVFARYERKKGKQVIFPVASHYSGVTAQNISGHFSNIFSKKLKISDEEEKIYKLYRNFYQVPEYILRKFVNPYYLLDFFSQEMLWELRSLNVSCDYENFYSTNIEDFSIFVNAIFSKYKELGLLIENKKGELALNYDDERWKEITLAQFKKTDFIQDFHKKHIIEAMRNIRSDWGILRKEGAGVIYKNKWIIDPMFDSELFTIFDLYVRNKKQYSKTNTDKKKLFERIFKSISGRKDEKSVTIDEIIKNLPCDLCVCEEHLKNWVVKKFYTESILLDEKYRTKKYFITGMGFLEGKRMSASRGHSILAKDLITEYGGVIARLVILLNGGHPSKMYNYDKSVTLTAKKIINNFVSYCQYMHTVSKSVSGVTIMENKTLYQLLSKKIEDNIQKGYLRQAVVDLLVVIPKKYKPLTKKDAATFIRFYAEYLTILLPGFLEDFDYSLHHS